MSEEILINITPQETRVAVVENGVLQEVQIERARARGLVGNIYKGVVSRVLPDMQAAFIEPAMGKTSLPLNIAEFVGLELKLPVLVFSMEMGGAQLGLRMLGSWAASMRSAFAPAASTPATGAVSALRSAS